MDRRITMIIQNEEFINIRQRFMESFLDTSSDDLHKDYFNNRILKTFDGLFYTGYFWDIFKNPKIVDEEEIFNYLNKLSSNIYVLWDNNIYCRDVKYPYFSVLKISCQEFKSILPSLPLDYYLFDESFSWVFALTHEDIGGKRYCVTMA